MPELWCPFAIRLEGPASKTGYQDDAGNRILETHEKVGIDYHTMEYESPGWYDDAKTLYNALFSGREASWTFSICSFFTSAVLYQHYPINTTTWAQGYLGNLWLIGIETESASHHKFTDAEYALLVKVSKWVKQELGWGEWKGVGSRQTKLTHGVNGWLFEHNNTPLAPGTDCAVFTHGQVDPERLLRDLREEDMGWMPKLIRISGQDEIMELRADGLFHIDGETYTRLGYDKLPVEVVAKDDSILKRRVSYPAGVPAEMH